MYKISAYLGDFVNAMAMPCLATKSNTEKISLQEEKTAQ